VGIDSVKIALKISLGWEIPNVQSMGNRFYEMNLSGTNAVREKCLIFSVSVDIRKEVVTGRANSDT